MIGKHRAALAFFCLALAQQLLFAQMPFSVDRIFNAPSSVSCVYEPGSMDNWIALSLTSLLVGMMIVGGVYVLSGVLNTPKLQNYLRDGLWNIVETFVIVALLTSAWFAGLAQYGKENIDKARAYSVIIRNTMMLDFSMVLGASIILSFFANVTPYFHPFGEKLGLLLSFSLAPAFRPIFDLIGILVQLLTIGTLEWFAHEFMLCFVKSKMLSIIMPAGIFLRVFGLKGGGNALIGIALALYFVYPFMLVQAGEFITDHFQGEINAAGKEVKHMWGCSLERPICCRLAGMPGLEAPASPQNFDELFLKNGNNWETDLNDRVSVESVLNGPIYLTLGNYTQMSNAHFHIQPEAGTGAACVFTTLGARIFKPIIDWFTGLQQWGLALMGGVAGLGATIYMLKMMNISWVFVAIMPMVINLVLAFLYETVYFVFVINMVLAVFIIFITLTLAKEIAKALGTEIDLSALEKLI